MIHGGGGFFGKQVAAGVGLLALCVRFTYAMLKVIDRVTPVRVGEAAEGGLDEAMHGESAYQFDEDLPVPGSAAPVL